MKDDDIDPGDRSLIPRVYSPPSIWPILLITTASIPCRLRLIQEQSCHLV